MEDTIIAGRNPVIEALKSDHEIEKILIAKGSEGSIRKIIGEAKERGIPLHYVEKSYIDKAAENMAHQGVLAYIAPYAYSDMEDILAIAQKRKEDLFVIILDGIEDPHNLGAIIRSADAAGAHGIIIPKRRAVGITGTVAKASAGAVEYVPVVRVPNLVQAINELKEAGIWVAAVDMDGQDHYKADLKGKIALVIGSEGKGISKLVKDNCDFIVKIPMKGKVSSLNASNAAAILMYEVLRQRDK